MPKFRKKPIVIEAVQWDGNPRNLVVAEFCGDHAATLSLTKELVITTREGLMRASIGDWIIRGVKGEFYPCKPDIFAETYEAVE